MIKAKFIFQGDNMNAAETEIRLRLKEIGVQPDKIFCWSSIKAEDIPEDWFDDYTFMFNVFIKTKDDLTDDILTDSESEEIDKLCEKIKNIRECEDVQRTNPIEYVAMSFSRENTSEYMSEILMDTETSTWKMFEELASAYICADNDQFREGLSQACGILTEHSLEGIAKNIIRKYKEE